MLGGTEWLVIFFAVLLLFGGQKIPELMRGLGKGIREFNTARSNIEAELRDGIREVDDRKRQEANANPIVSVTPPIAPATTPDFIERIEDKPEGSVQ